MKNRKFLKAIWKKKANRLIAAAFIFVLGVGIFAVTVRLKGVRTKEASVSRVQSAAVTKGSISNTIDASGNLEAAETIDVTLPAGIKVVKVKTESGEEVTKGQTLATLDKSSIARLLADVRENLETVNDKLDASTLSALEKEGLKGEKEELEETEKTLSALYKKPVVKAPSDGIVSTVYVSENTETSADTPSEDTASDSTAQNNSSLSRMSEKDTGNTPSLLFLTADTDTASSVSEPDDTNSPSPASGTEDTSAPSSGEDNALKTVDDFSSLTIQPPVTGAIPQKSISETNTYKGTISWDCSGSTFQGGISYTATVVLTAKSGCTFSEKNLPVIKDASFNWNIYHTGEGNTLKITAKYEKTSEIQNSKDNTEKKSQESAGISGSTGKSSGKSAGISSSTGSSKSSSLNGAASDDSVSDSAAEYSSCETAAFTLAKQDNAKITVNVDELDILSVEKDQTASVTLDALENETFTGKVSKISTAAVAGSGSTKYEVEITVPMDERMRIGMSASASIQVNNAENTLILPMTALQQRGTQIFVYTAKSSGGELAGEVTVETGLSDGQNVEILRGLSEGTQVYYTRTGSSRDDSERDVQFPGGMPDGKFIGGVPGSGGTGGNGNMPGSPSDGSRKRQDSGSSRSGGQFSGGNSGN